MTEWEGSDGTAQRGMSVTVSKIITLADAKREREKKQKAEGDNEPFFDDELPF